MKAYQSLPQAPFLCPKNRLGHSWRTLAHTASEVAQQCRFCDEKRTIPTYRAQHARRKTEE